MLLALFVILIFIMIGWGVISAKTAPKSGPMRHRSGGDGGSSVAYADSGNSDGGCDGGGSGGGGD
ncbi:hypothetical protein [Paenibacillus arenilitoris]|uniref:Uncharacterized protein n=1 Tax=Paenibacillus arenilitoris TaxID=2772299 RepID=A0A927H8H4_9BACL|nr:hypothetical protein [Paenibacillus arenilitoris]MBD2871683.1 hypothetical protein [Paenibacillus arenilitoris]